MNVHPTGGYSEYYDNYRLVIWGTVLLAGGTWGVALESAIAQDGDGVRGSSIPTKGGQSFRRIRDPTQVPSVSA